MVLMRDPKNEKIVGKEEKFDNSKFFLQHGVDLEKRRISIHGNINRENTSYIIRALHKMHDSSKTEAIDVFIDTYGGGIYNSFSIYDTIRKSPCYVRTHAEGKVMSAGILIYLAGDERYALPNATFMLHSGSSGTYGKAYEQAIDVRELERLNKIMYKLYAENTNKTAAWWAKELEFKDKYYNVEQALKLGIVTMEEKD
jgi:ATP-dependent Clp protease protease subunit